MFKKLFQLFSNFLSKRNLYLIKSLPYKPKSRLLPINLDYVRYTTLSLCYQEITKQKLDGNLAEVGVYRGDFAKRLNILFPDKKLYLFDTFEGFSNEDSLFEQQKNYSTATQDFTNTSIELVKSKMKYPDNCIFKKGKFPDTAIDVEDQFCFVSLDADLYLPIYEGLKFFYPSLVKKGYIFIHDFNNDQYTGAREAVIQFCQEQNIGFTPIPDIGGTVVITK
jgi:O-methyltransferase